MASGDVDDRVICGPPEPVEPPSPGSPGYGERLLANLERGGDDIAQISSLTGEYITYNQIRERAIRLAVALQKLGIKKGDSVAVCSENRFEFSICAVAVIAIGAVNANLNILYTRDEVIHIMKISNPVCVFASPITLSNIIDVKRDVSSLKHIISFGTTKPHPSIILFNELFTEKLDIATFKPVDVDVMTHPLAILCSSGTTGMPKGVLITQRNSLICNPHLFLFMEKSMRTKHTILTFIPWFHAYGFLTQLAYLYLNIKIVFMTKFEEESFLMAIQEYKATLTMVVPPVMVFLAKHPLVDKYDLSSLVEIWCAAAPLSKDVQQAVTKRLGIKIIKQAYGMTETTLAVLHNGMGKALVKYGSCGQIVPGTKVKVIDLKTGEALGPFKEGELCFKGPLMMAGYLGDPAATESIFDSNGWLHTGDVGYYDEEKYFYIVDRIKELIKYKAYQVPPAEIEALLLKYSGVKDSAVIGIPDEKAGELPMAFVVKQPGANVTEKDLVDFVAAHVSVPKRLHGGVRFVDEIPKNPTGKILRRELRALINKQQSRL